MQGRYGCWRCGCCCGRCGGVWRTRVAQSDRLLQSYAGAFVCPRETHPPLTSPAVARSEGKRRSKPAISHALCSVDDSADWRASLCCQQSWTANCANTQASTVRRRERRIKESSGRCGSGLSNSTTEVRTTRREIRKMQTDFRRLGCTPVVLLACSHSEQLTQLSVSATCRLCQHSRLSGRLEAASTPAHPTAFLADFFITSSSHPLRTKMRVHPSLSADHGCCPKMT